MIWFIYDYYDKVAPEFLVYLYPTNTCLARIKNLETYQTLLISPISKTRCGGVFYCGSSLMDRAAPIHGEF